MGMIRLATSGVTYCTTMVRRSFTIKRYHESAVLGVKRTRPLGVENASQRTPIATHVRSVRGCEHRLNCFILLLYVAVMGDPLALTSTASCLVAEFRGVSHQKK